MIDHYGRTIDYLRISVTDLCNLRCRYCMPAEGIEKRQREDMLTEEELGMAIRAAAELGIRKIRITGGEPLVKCNIIRICEMASATPGVEEVCMTTNGILLRQYAGELKQAGVSRLNISLDTLNQDKYHYITRVGELLAAWDGIHAALEEGFEKIKINTVLIGGFNEAEIRDLAEISRKYPVDVRFIEMMPMYDSGDFDKDAFISGKKVLEVLPELEAKGTGGVAKLYRLPGALGSVGLINPISAHFCQECNRLRLTADGKIRPCLHSSLEYSVKGKTFEEMKRAFLDAVEGKPEWHGELSYNNRSKAGRNMNRIGG